MKILKFGGTSVATAERMQQIAGIVGAARAGGPVAVVTSALGGVTDSLVEAAGRASTGDPSYRHLLAELASRHHETLTDAAPPQELDRLRAELDRTLGDLTDLLHGVQLVREASVRTRDRILSYGERLSAPLLAAALRKAGLDAEPRDARELVVTNRCFGAAQADLEATGARARALFSNATGRPIQVVTGFLGATHDGETTTLGRGGSDSTAALLGAVLATSGIFDGDVEVELWTDVNGVMSADPRIVPEAAPIPAMAYDELMELAHFGAKVVHPPSIHPARQAGVRLWIKNTFAPERPGTRVDPNAGSNPDPERPVTGVASIRRVALLRVEGDGMIGVAGVAGRVFGALARAGVNVILISQASSEHSICLAIAPDDVAAATEALGVELALERHAGHVDPLVVEEDLAIVAAVGAGMRQRAGIAGRLFGVLGEHGVNVRAIAQGSSELNISLVVGAEDETTAVRIIHDAFVLPRRRQIELVLVGTGRVGGALLEQLGTERQALGARGLRPRLRAVVASQRMLIDAEGLDPASAIDRLRSSDDSSSEKVPSEPADLDAIAALLASSPGRCRILIDCTANEDVPDLYAPMLRAGVHVVTANKRRLAGPMEAWRNLIAATQTSSGAHGRLYHETTVGAGLPVVMTLESLVATGDQVRRIEGVLSGTLAYLADQLAAGLAFSAAVRQAHELGYTEPDPREDLSGQDVARKLLILARVAGFTLEPENVEVEALLPDSWSDLSLETFWERLPELDDSFAERRAAVASAGQRWVYLAELSGSTEHSMARVALRALGSEHPCGGLRGTDNLIAFTTDRYRETPLVVRGPGAGPEVTAAGVFGDLLRAIAESSGDR